MNECEIMLSVRLSLCSFNTPILLKFLRSTITLAISTLSCNFVKEDNYTTLKTIFVAQMKVKSHKSSSQSQMLSIFVIQRKQFIEISRYFLHKQGKYTPTQPENILWSTNDEEAVLKIADFGFAKILAEHDMMTTACGTPLY